MTYQNVEFAQSVTDARELGRNVFVMQSISADRAISISRESCEGLSDLASVVRSGFLVDLGRSRVFPVGADVPILGGSVSLFPALTGQRTIVGNAIFQSPTLEFVTIDGLVKSSKVGAAEPLGFDVNSGVLIPLAGTISESGECLVEMERFANREDLRVASAQLDVVGGAVLAFSQYGDVESLPAAFLNRDERWFPLYIGIGAGAATALAIRGGRGEFAAYSFGGTSPFAFSILLVLQCGLIGGVATLSAILAGSVLAQFSTSPSALLLSAIAFGGSLVSTALPLSLPMARSSSVELGKRR